MTFSRLLFILLVFATRSNCIRQHSWLQVTKTVNIAPAIMRISSMNAIESREDLDTKPRKKQEPHTGTLWRVQKCSFFISWLTSLCISAASSSFYVISPMLKRATCPSYNLLVLVLDSPGKGLLGPTWVQHLYPWRLGHIMGMRLMELQ